MLRFVGTRKSVPTSSSIIYLLLETTTKRTRSISWHFLRDSPSLLSLRNALAHSVSNHIHCISLRFCIGLTPSCNNTVGRLLSISRADAYSREFAAHLLRFDDHARAQHVLGALGVDVAVGRVQLLRLLHPLRRILRVAGVLQSRHTHTAKNYRNQESKKTGHYLRQSQIVKSACGKLVGVPKYRTYDSTVLYCLISPENNQYLCFVCRYGILGPRLYIRHHVALLLKTMRFLCAWKYLVDLGFGHEQFDEGGSVLNGAVDIEMSLMRVGQTVVVLRQEVVHPEHSRRRLHIARASKPPRCIASSIQSSYRQDFRSCTRFPPDP